MTDIFIRIVTLRKLGMIWIMFQNSVVLIIYMVMKIGRPILKLSSVSFL